MTIELAKTPLEKFAYTLLIDSARHENTTILEVLGAFLENNSDITLADVRLILAALIEIQRHPSDNMDTKRIVHHLVNFGQNRAGANAGA